MQPSKTTKQFRATLNHNNTHVSITSDNQNELKAVCEGAAGSPLEFREVQETTLIFQKGEPNPIGWSSAYSVPESMSLSGIRRGQLQLEKVAA
jgi:hypothetical protein